MLLTYRNEIVKECRRPCVLLQTQSLWQEWHSYLCVSANYSSLFRHTNFFPSPSDNPPPNPHLQSLDIISISKQYLVPLSIFSLISYPHSVFKMNLNLSYLYRIYSQNLKLLAIFPRNIFSTLYS